MTKFFAAVGNDGTRPVVWGLGRTEDEALEEAHNGLVHTNSTSELEVHEITSEQYATINEGDVSWPVSVERLTLDVPKVIFSAHRDAQGV